MCTNQALKCILFAPKNHKASSFDSSSTLSGNYFYSTDSRTNSTQIKIHFNQKPKLLTGIDAKTTFGDLIAAILISSAFQVDNDLDSELIRAKAHEYVICESRNHVEKCLEPSLRVKCELDRIACESALVEPHKYKVRHTMRHKLSIQCLRICGESKSGCKKILAESNSHLFSETNDDDNNNNNVEKRKPNEVVGILEEFMLGSNIDEKVFVGTNRGENGQHNIGPNNKMSLKKALLKFDRYIEERREYVRLLEEYLVMLEDLEEHFDWVNDELVVYDSDSTQDTGFDSVTSSVESLRSSFNLEIGTYV
jgi:hypothetical protein